MKENKTSPIGSLASSHAHVLAQRKPATCVTNQEINTSRTRVCTVVCHQALFVPFSYAYVLCFLLLGSRQVSLLRVRFYESEFLKYFV